MSLARSVQICTPPSVLLEVINTPKIEVRDRIVDALRSKHWKRLPTEIASEAKEIVGEAKWSEP